MQTPTGADLRAWAPPAFDWSAAGYPPPSGGDTDPLDARAAWYAADVAKVAGRPLADFADEDELIAQQAITLWAVQKAMGGSLSALNAMSKPWLKSFTAGSYSETRFSGTELAGVSKDVIARLNPNAELAMLLWLLMSDEKKAEWKAIVTGQVAPAGVFANQGFDDRYYLDDDGRYRIANAFDDGPYDFDGLIE